MSEREKISEQLSAYLDGELPPAEAKAVDQALSQDADLRRELERMRAVRQLLAALPRQNAPKDFAASVMEQAERRQLMAAADDRRPGGRLQAVRFAATAAVVLIAAAMGYFMVTSLTWQAPAPPARHPIDSSAPLADKPPGPPGEMVAAKGAARDEIATEKDAARRVPAKPPDRPTPAEPAPSPTIAAKPGPAVAAREAKAPAKGYAAKAAAAEPRLAGAVANVVLYTHDLSNTQRDVEKLLAANSVAMVRADRPGEAGADDALRRRAGRQSFYFQNRASDRQVQYLAVVPVGQVRRVSAQLLALRARQRVPQAAPAGPEQAKEALDEKAEHAGRIAAAAVRKKAAPRQEAPAKMTACRLALGRPARRGAEQMEIAKVDAYPVAREGQAVQVGRPRTQAFRAGANVQQVLITLNFRPLADAPARAAAPASRPGTTPATK